jgi:hypothetical protein
VFADAARLSRFVPHGFWVQLQRKLSVCAVGCSEGPLPPGRRVAWCSISLFPNRLSRGPRTPIRYPKPHSRSFLIDSTAVTLAGVPERYDSSFSYSAYRRTGARRSDSPDKLRISLTPH